MLKERCYPYCQHSASHVPIDHQGDGKGLTGRQVEQHMHERMVIKAMAADTSGARVAHCTSDGDLHKSTDPLGAEASLGKPKYKEHRPARHLSFYTQTLVVLVVIGAECNFVHDQVTKTLEDHLWFRLVNILWIPCVVVFMLFSLQFALNQIICSVGPIAHMQTNSKFFRPLEYPLITIQMPVYKEGLEATIIPTIRSLEVAMSHYRKAGGVVRIFINDDGLQVIPPAEAAARLRVYKDHDIAYVARPPNSVKRRKGLFKKASNMNYAMNASLRVSDLMTSQGLSLRQATEQTMVDLNYECCIGGDVRLGDIILLIDSDTRVPPDCLTKVVGEFEASDNLGFLQCRTTPLMENDSYWNDMISHFTTNIYDVGIALAVSAGDPSPLVGHNAFLRWRAVWQGSHVDPEDGERKFWSEKHVSEDFDMSLRLQTLGYIGRYCTYTGAGFQEGVSLTAADEVIRLRKYAFGSCEMMLNRFKDWPTKGLLTPMYRSYLSSPAVKWPAKLQMTGYLGTYLAMAYSIIGIYAYVLLRAYAPGLQQGLTNTFDIFMTVFLLFGGIGVLGAGAIRYRMGLSNANSIFESWALEFKNSPTMTVFFSHVLWHITTACFNYFFDIEVTWGATLKELSNGSFGTELKNTLYRYRAMYISLCLLTVVWFFIMVAGDLPFDDLRLSCPIALYMGMHMLGPLLLNPTLMRLNY